MRNADRTLDSYQSTLAQNGKKMAENWLSKRKKPPFPRNGKGGELFDLRPEEGHWPAAFGLQMCLIKIPAFVVFPVDGVL